MKFLGLIFTFSVVAFSQGLLTSYVNAGGSSYTDASGVRWIADSSYSGGSPNTTTGAIAGTNGQTATYQSARSGYNFGYSFSVNNGTYSVTFKFADWESTATGQRVFSVYAPDGTALLSSYDIFKAAGGRSIVRDETITLNVCDGTLGFSFKAPGVAENVLPGKPAQVNGFVIRQTGASPSCIGGRTPITACGTYGPGNYTFPSKISSCPMVDETPVTYAVEFVGSGSVTVDCGGSYAPYGIKAGATVDLTVSNCVFDNEPALQDAKWYGIYTVGGALHVSGSRFLKFSHILVRGSSSVVIDDNYFEMGGPGIVKSSNVLISHNRFETGSATYHHHDSPYRDLNAYYGPFVAISFSTSTVISDNIIGSDMTLYDPSEHRHHFDNLVQLTATTGVTIHNNLIRGVEVTGIEFVGTNTDTVIENNSLVDTGQKAIGGSYGIAIIGATIRNNTLSTTVPLGTAADNAPVYASQRLFYLNKKYRYLYPDTTATFINNHIENNRVLSAVNVTGNNLVDMVTVQAASGADLQIGEPTPVTYPLSTVVYGNYFYNNYLLRNDLMQSLTVPLLNTPGLQLTGSGYQSLGGNICNNAYGPTGINDAPIDCSTLSVSTPDSLVLTSNAPGYIRFAADGGASGEYSVTVTGLPPGMAASRTWCPPAMYCPWQGKTQQGISIYGTPTIPGAYTVTVTVYEAGDRWAQAIASLPPEVLALIGLMKTQSFTVTVSSTPLSCSGNGTNGTNWVVCYAVGADQFDESKMSLKYLDANPFPWAYPGAPYWPTSESFGGNFTFPGGFMIFPLNLCGNATLYIDGIALPPKSSKNATDSLSWVYDVSSGTHNVRLNWTAVPGDCNGTYGVNLHSWTTY